MSQLSTHDEIDRWSFTSTEAKRQQLIEQLENGQVLFFPHLAFKIADDLRLLLSPDYISSSVKNISYFLPTDTLKGIDKNLTLITPLKQLLNDYATHTRALMYSLFPHYEKSLILGRTSYRPIEIQGRQSSYRKDDTRLHVDAFPSTPVQGYRILRFFSNINPFEKPRIWHLGEPFSEVMQQFTNKIEKPFPGKHYLLNKLKITKKKRSLYDHYMLSMHDQMKKDEDYQRKAIQEKLAFPSQSSWIVYTDLVSHAALSGQYALEQTFYLPAQEQYQPELSPLKRLEKYLGEKLVNN